MENVTVADITAFAKISIEGKGAKKFLDYMVANKIPEVIFAIKNGRVSNDGVRIWRKNQGNEIQKLLLFWSWFSSEILFVKHFVQLKGFVFITDWIWLKKNEILLVLIMISYVWFCVLSREIEILECLYYVSFYFFSIHSRPYVILTLYGF